MMQPPDLAKVAQNVGPTSRRNCGTCHFLGGGGNAIKHGDLDLSLLEPGRYLDIHMSPDRLNFTCSSCHSGDAHAVQGSRYTTNAKDTSGIDIPGRTDGSRATCESCHGMEPHPSGSNAKLNEHTDKIACATCHVPRYAATARRCGGTGRRRAGSTRKASRSRSATATGWKSTPA
jgi:Zn finger protein HypA/HybF involved in hydrogenase expression